MTLAEAVVNVLLSAGIVAAVSWCGYRVVVWARRQEKGAYVVGAVLSPIIALGKVTDPDFRIVMEAKQHKKREEGEPGDPPNPLDDAGLEALTVDSVAPPPKARPRKPWWRIWRR
jgi:hypothetical protein